MSNTSNSVNFYKDCLAELYPFSESDLSFFKEELNFKILSANRKVKWSFELINDYKNLWDWKVLDCNKSLFERVTLGLLFPDKINLNKCDCYRMEDFCEESTCAINASRLIYHSRLYDEDIDTYLKLSILCDSEVLDREMMFVLFRNEDTSQIEKLIKSSFYNNS